MNFWVIPLPPMDLVMIWIDSTPSKLSKKSKIMQFEVQTKNIRPREVKGGFSKTPHAAPLKICAVSVYLMASNDSKLDILDSTLSLLSVETKIISFGGRMRGL